MRSETIETAELSVFHREVAANFHSVMRGHYRAHAKNFGVNPDTLLSPDVLNQYARLIMLFEIFPAAPYTVGPHLFKWRPKDYSRYFVESKHPEQRFILRARPYANAKAASDFEAALARLNDVAARGLGALRLFMAHGRAHEARSLCKASADAVRIGVAEAAAIAAPEMTGNLTRAVRF